MYWILIGLQVQDQLLRMEYVQGRGKIPYKLTPNLRSKRSHTKRTKFGLRKGAFHIAKRWKEGGGGDERRELLHANPSILKNWFVHERGS